MLPSGVAILGLVYLSAEHREILNAHPRLFGLVAFIALTTFILLALDKRKS